MKNEFSTLQSKVEELEKTEILNALRETRWIKARAARLLGITQRMVSYKIRKYKLQREVNTQVSMLKADEYIEENSISTNKKEDES